MKYLDIFVTIILLSILMAMCVDKVEFGKEGVKPKFTIGDNVYVLPDSTKAIVEKDFIMTDKGEKKNGVRTRKIFAESYTIIYTDKNGVVQRLRQVNPDILIKMK